MDAARSGKNVLSEGSREKRSMTGVSIDAFLRTWNAAGPGCGLTCALLDPVTGVCLVVPGSEEGDSEDLHDAVEQAVDDLEACRLV